MGAVLTSWKEIAAYVNKGVRTVQRWEKEQQLPVRRSGQSVLAIPKEIDAWVRTRPLQGDGVNSLDLELRKLRKALTELQEENEALREELGSIGGAKPQRAEGTEISEDATLAYCHRLVKASAQLRRESAETKDLSRNLRVLLRQQLLDLQKHARDDKVLVLRLLKN